MTTFWKPGTIAPGSSTDRANENEGTLSMTSYSTQPSTDLPISKYKRQLMWLIEHNQVVILVGQTGSGKTTQLPQYLLETGWATKPYSICCTQPRRVAATSIANRVALEVGSVIGHEVGYTIRFEDCSNENTRIKYMTDGILLREIMLDPLLTKYSVIIIDEAHERTCNTDILLGIIKKILKHRSDLRIVISSATINAKDFENYFSDKYSTSILSVDGRQYDYEVVYSQQNVDDYVESAVNTAININKNENEGDILIFLTGREDIDRGLQMLSDITIGKNDTRYLKLYGVPLHAGLKPEEEMKVFESTPARMRKVIFSTNVAEASVTIEGIKFVIDTGLVKTRRFDVNQGIEVLETVACSKQSLTQRAGRVGRTMNGKCFRLFEEKEMDNLEEKIVPDICKSELSSAILQLKVLGVVNVVRFEYLDRPPSKLLMWALENLYINGCMDEEGELTDLGKKLGEMPIDLKMAKMILNGDKYGCTSEMITIAAMMSVQNPFSYGNGIGELERRKFVAEEGDHLTLLNGYNGFVKYGKSSKSFANKHKMNFKVMSRAVYIRQQLKIYMNKFGIKEVSCEGDEKRIRKCIYESYKENVVRSLGNGDYEELRSGMKLRAHPSSVLFDREPKSKYLIYNEKFISKGIYLKDLTVIDVDWLIEEKDSH